MQTSILIKVGKEEHLQKFQNEGMLHCETLDYFANIEDGSRRGDKTETATEFFNNANYILTIFDKIDSNKSIKIKLQKAHFSEQKQPINLFCLYAVNIFDHEENTPFILEQRFNEKEWGTHFIIITQAQTFVERVKTVLVEMKLGMISDFVRYVDLANYKGENDGFIKDESYSYQKEFRIRIKNYESKCIDIFVGNLSEVTSSIYSLDVFKTLKMYYKKFNPHFGARL